MTRVATGTPAELLEGNQNHNHSHINESKQQEPWRPTRTIEHEPPVVDQQQAAAPRDQPRQSSRVGDEQQNLVKSILDHNHGPHDAHNERRQVEMANRPLTRAREPLASIPAADKLAELQEQQVQRLDRPQACSRQAAMAANNPIALRQQVQANGGGRCGHKVADDDDDQASREGATRRDQEEFRPKASVKSLISRFNMA